MKQWKLVLVAVVIGGIVGLLKQMNSGSTEYKCADRSKAILAWREKCPDMSHMLAWAPFNPSGVYQKWCDCLENKFDIQAAAGTECKVSSDTVRGLWERDEVKVACGVPNAPR